MRKAYIKIAAIAAWGIAMGFMCGCAKTKPQTATAPAYVSPCPDGYIAKGAIESGRPPNHHTIGILFIKIGDRDMQSGMTAYEICAKK